MSGSERYHEFKRRAASRVSEQFLLLVGQREEIKRERKEEKRGGRKKRGLHKRSRGVSRNRSNREKEHNYNHSFQQVVLELVGDLPTL